MLGLACVINTNSELIRGICENGYKQCETVNICIVNELVCDGKIICPDESDEKYCHNIPEITSSRMVINENDFTTVFTTSPSDNDFIPEVISDIPFSEESINPSSIEAEHDFLVGDDADHCNHYKRMIHLVRRVHTRMSKMDARTAKVITLLINEILMEAGMENFSSLLELHHVCSNQKGLKRHHQTTTILPS